MIKEDVNLLNDFEDTYLKRKRNCRCFLIISLIIISLIIIIILYHSALSTIFRAITLKCFKKSKKLANIIFLFFNKTVENKEEIDNAPKDNTYNLDRFS